MLSRGGGGRTHHCLCSSLQKLYILGGEVAESAQKCTHLIASKVTRTVKFLTAISVVRHIVTPEWLEECFKCQKFIGRCCCRVLAFPAPDRLFPWCLSAFVPADTSSLFHSGRLPTKFMTIFRVPASPGLLLSCYKVGGSVIQAALGKLSSLPPFAGC